MKKKLNLEDEEDIGKDYLHEKERKKELGRK